MFKELIISLVIVVSIFVGNNLTEKYTKASVEETTNNLEELRKEILKEDDEINFNDVKQKIDEIHEKWDQKYEKLAYYIEHNELEKVETELTGLRGHIEKQDYKAAVSELDRSIYILDHVKDKNAFDLKNIF